MIAKSSIDRIAPSRRPHGRAAGYHRWRDLLFLHWPVPAELLRPLVPATLELDSFDGTAYVGVIPFRLRGVRSRWWPWPLALNFLETNVRTYVRCGGVPGIYFFSLDANSRLAVWGAQCLWGLPYHYAYMSFERRGQEMSHETCRASDGARHRVHFRIGELLGPSRPGTIEHFLLERYWLFVARGGGLLGGQVHHVPYPAQAAQVLCVHDDLIGAAGLPQPAGPPTFAHYAAGVDVEIFGLKRMEP